MGYEPGAKSFIMGLADMQRKRKVCMKSYVQFRKHNYTTQCDSFS